MMSNPKKYTDKNRWIKWALRKRAARFLPDKIYLSLLFNAKVGRKIDWENPQTYSEKLQWLKIHDRKPFYTNLVDKYEFRKYIAKTIGEDHLIPLIGVWDRFEDIDFASLPSQFVLKCTHDSGGLVICKDKGQLDIEAAREKIEKSLKNNYYYHSREWPYKNVKPRIICERYMVDESGVELKDYKIMCFNGKVKCSFVCSNRNSKCGLNIDIFDNDWNLMPFERPGHPNSGNKIPKPQNFDEMLKFAETISKDMPFVRVDYYEINGKLYIGELTFYPASGFGKFIPESYDYILGSWMVLPEK